MKFFTEASPLRRAILALGGLAFTAGIALVVFAAVSSLGGDDKPDIEVRDLGTPTERPATPSPTPGEITVTPVPAPPLPEQQYSMVVDKIGVNAPVLAYGLDANAVPEVPTDDNAADVIAWYNFSARPGTGSNAVFAGHVTWFGAAVFYSLDTLTNGDQIKLVGQDGTTLVYQVSDVFQVVASDPDSLQVMSATPEDMITIITCDGTFTDTNDPVFGGEYDNRLVVRATRVPDAAVAAGG
jgi:LPXTG-site transpeptidase (sortase) family protein